LDLYGCEVTKLPDYKESVFSLIPSLKSLDQVNKDGTETQDNVFDTDDEEEEEEVCYI